MRLGVVHRLPQAHLHPADGVDHLLEAAEVQHHVVIDPHPREPLDRTDRAGGPAPLEGPVELGEALGGTGPVGGPAGGHLRHQVPGYRDGRHAPAVRRQVQQDRRVGTLRAAVLPVARVLPAGARVRADQQDVLGAVREVRRALALVAAQFRLRGGVRGDVPVELLVQPPAGGRARQDQQDGPEPDPAQQAPATAGRRPRPASGRPGTARYARAVRHSRSVPSPNRPPAVRVGTAWSRSCPRAARTARGHRPVQGHAGDRSRELAVRRCG